MGLGGAGIGLTRGGQQAVTDLLRGEPATHMATEQAGGIVRHSLLAVGGTLHHQPVQLLQAIPRTDELTSQMIKQFGMTGWGAAGAKITGRSHNTPAHVPLPYPVDHHPGGERVVWRGEPVGQLEPATRLTICQRLPPQNVQIFAGNRVTGFFGVASQMQPGVSGFSLSDGKGDRHPAFFGAQFSEVRIKGGQRSGGARLREQASPPLG